MNNQGYPMMYMYPNQIPNNLNPQINISRLPNSGMPIPSGPLSTNQQQIGYFPQFDNNVLPQGWEKQVDSQGRVYYIDHLNKKTQWEPPMVNNNQTRNNSQLSPTNPITINPNIGNNPNVSISPNQMLYPGYVLNQSNNFNPNPQTNQYYNPQFMSQIQPKTNPINNSSINTSTTNLANSEPTYKKKDAVKCVKCGAEFKLFKRKSSCKCCCRDFCSDCLTKSHDVNSFKLTNAKVCNTCFDHLEKGIQSCLSRLVPYLLEEDQNVVTQALSEVSTEIQKGNNVNEVGNIGIIQPLFVVISLGNPTNKTKSLTILSLIAAKNQLTKELLDKDDNMQIIFNCLLSNTNSIRLESLKAIAFLSMKQENKQLFLVYNLVEPVLQLLTLGTDEDTQMWASMTLYYLTASTVDQSIYEVLFGGISNIIHILSNSKNVKTLQFLTGIIESLSKSSLKSSIHETGGIDILLQLLKNPDQAIRLNIIGSLISLSTNQSARSSMIRGNAISSLLELISSTIEVDLQNQGLTLIFTLISNAFDTKTIVEQLLTGIDYFINNLSSEVNEQIQSAVLELLKYLAKDPVGKQKLGSTNIILTCFNILMTCDKLTLSPLASNALHVITFMGIGNEDNIANIIECGALSTIVSFLGSKDSNSQYEASSCISLLSSSEKVVNFLPELGALQHLLELLYSSNMEVRSNVMQTFANLADHPLWNDMILNSGEIDNFVQSCSSENPKIQRCAVKIICNLTKESKNSEVIGNYNGLFSGLISQLSTPNEEVKRETYFAILQCCKTSRKARESINNSGGLPIIVKLLASKDPELLSYASEVVALFSMEHQYRSAIKEAGGVVLVVDNLFSTDGNIQKWTAITVSNIVTSVTDADTIHNHGGLFSILNFLNSTNPEVVSSAALAIGNLAHSDACRRSMIEGGAVAKLLQILQHDDERVQYEAINALSTIAADPGVAMLLPQHQGLKSLASLLSSPNNDIKSLAIHVIMNICRDNAQNWERFMSVAGLRGLVAMSSSSNPESQRRAVHELASLSVDAKHRKSIFEIGAIPTLLSILSLQKIPISTQIESIIALANLSLEENCIEEITKGIHNVIPYLFNQNGKYAILSAVKILANSLLVTKDILSISKKILEQNAVRKLAEILFSDENDLRIYVSFILAKLIEDQDIAYTLIELGCVSQLLKLITSSTVDEKIHLHLINILKSLCSNEKGRKELFSGNSISSLITQLHRNEVLFIIHSLSQEDENFALSLTDEHLSIIIQSFLKIISNKNHDSIMIMLDIISKITKRSYSANIMLVKYGILPVLHQFLRNDNMMIITSEILSNVAVISEIHGLFLEQGILEAILDILFSIYSERNNESIDLLSQQAPPFQAPADLNVEDKNRLVNSILGSLIYLSINESNRLIIEKEKYFKIIILIILESQSPLIISKCIDVLSNLSYDVNIRKTLQNDFIIKLFELLTEQIDLISNILSLLTVLTMDKINSQILRDYGVMPLVSLLSNTNDDIVILTLQILSNLIRYDECRKIIQSYIDHQVLSNLRNKSNNNISNLAKSMWRFIGKYSL